MPRAREERKHTKKSGRKDKREDGDNTGTEERYGASIDDHDIVIRFNDGPTQGFEDVVGSRTTIRVLNNKWTSSMLEGSSLSLTPRLAVNSSVLLFGKSNVHHVGSVCGSFS